jgi:hypothetical protein
LLRMINGSHDQAERLLRMTVNTNKPTQNNV